MASRSSNWTRLETDVLVDGYVEYRDILFGKFSEKVTNEEKQKKFSTVLESINAVGGNGRSMDEMKSKWKDLKCRTVAKARRHRKEGKQTGGGDAVPELTAVQEKVLSCVPNIILDGLEGNDTGPMETPENENNSETVSPPVPDEEDIVSRPLKKRREPMQKSASVPLNC